METVNSEKKTLVTRTRPVDHRDVLQRCPRLVAHLICESLGYATPTGAAMIIADAVNGEENWCEWIFCCYRRDPRPAVRNAIRHRHTHYGYMAHYPLARQIVERARREGEEPLFGSWF